MIFCRRVSGFKRGILARMVGRILILGVTTLSAAYPQSSSTPSLLDIQSLMTVAEYRRAGLTKLSPEELLALNRWLTRYSLQLYSAAPAKPQTEASGDVVETQIAGEFNGWDGETIFRLDNGQIWQQSSYAYTYHYSYRPKLLIYRSNGSFRMKVDDVEDTILVKRLK